MAGRANWKGHLRLSLVSCSVGLYPAVSTSSHLKCHTINRKTGNRIKEVVVDSVTDEPVDREDRIKGCEVAKDELVPIEQDELDTIALESTHTINIESFCKRDEVDERYLDRPYYLAPEDKVSREAFGVIRDAMQAQKMAGLGRLVIYRRERIVLLEPYGKGLLATLLRYQDEVRSPTTYFEDMPDGNATTEMRELAEQLIERATKSFDPKNFEDRYEGALIALVQGKAETAAGKSKAGKAAKSKPSGNVVNLMEALKRSIASEKGGKASSSPPARRAAPSRRVAATKTASPRKAASRKAG